MRNLKPSDYVRITGKKKQDLRRVKVATRHLQGQSCWFCDNPKGIAGPILEIVFRPHVQRAVPVVSLCEKCRADLKRQTAVLVADGDAVMMPVFP